MRKPLLSLVVSFVVLAMSGLSHLQAQNNEELALGAQAPLTDHAVKDVSGKMITLKEVAGEKGLLVVFSCNTCPWVSRWEDRYNPIAQLAEENGIGTIALNPNTTYRDKGDGFEDMQQRAKKSKYTFFYALDENSELAKAFGATHTPHIFLFNSDMELVYKGAIDDNAASAEGVEEPWLKNALMSLGSGEEIAVKSTKSLGCTIKWPQ